MLAGIRTLFRLTFLLKRLFFIYHFFFFAIIYIYIYIYIYLSLTSTTLSRRLTMHLSNTISIAQHLKKHSCPTTQLRKILTDNTTILEHQNNKQKLQILEHYILETCNQHLIELIFKPVLMYLNVFSYRHYLQNFI